MNKGSRRLRIFILQEDGLCIRVITYCSSLKHTYMRESLQVLDTIHLNFTQEGLFVLNLTLAFIMFGVALEIKPEQFKRVALNPKAAIVGFISQFFFLPAVTFIMIIIAVFRSIYFGRTHMLSTAWG